MSNMPLPDMRRFGSEARSYFFAMCRQGNVAQATMAFEQIHEGKNVVLWTAVISANARFGHYRDALTLFHRMQLEGIYPNAFTFWALLYGCSSLRTARKIHSWAKLCNCHEEQMVRKSLIRAYGNCRSLRDAEAVFSCIGADLERDLIMWTTMITAYARNGHSHSAFHMFHRMQLSGVSPDFVAFLAILESCSSLKQVKMIHLCIQEKGLDTLLIVGNCLITVYSNCGCPEGAKTVFEKLNGARDVVSWNSILTSYARYLQYDRVLETYEKMKEAKVAPVSMTFVPLLEACNSLEVGRIIHKDLLGAGLGNDLILQSNLILMYFKCGSLEDGKHVFEGMDKRDAIVWTTMISACCNHGEYEDALTFFRRMLQDNSSSPTEVTITMALGACGCLNSLQTGKLLHLMADEKHLINDIVITALVGMYCKCGSLQDARILFEDYRNQDPVMWNIMVASYAQQGRFKEASAMFERMQLEGVVPDDITFVVMLSSFSHEGLLLRACKCYESMIRDYGITPSIEHCGCMTDVLGRVGWLDEAKGFVDGMATFLQVEANTVIWASLLHACKVHGHITCGQAVALEALEEGDPGSYALLSNMYIESID